eukprot:TRINITY_DN3595_c0_g1_i4.p1 TRINITY_DN3595_c0_g1~~TRINITY_DN3595_c0_g1_i4.p1  ORF type:complete len:369 (-),score=87.43 TRINITY_DN3595_c0_g1_i4:138-1244(-)
MSTNREKHVKNLYDKFPDAIKVTENTEYQVIRRIGSETVTVNLKFPPTFPGMAPVVTVRPELLHPILSQDMRVTELSELRNWSIQSSLASLVTSVFDAFYKSPPVAKRPGAPTPGGFAPVPPSGTYPMQGVPPQQYPLPQSGHALGPQPPYTGAPYGSGAPYSGYPPPSNSAPNHGYPPTNPMYGTPYPQTPQFTFPTLQMDRILSVIDKQSLETLRELSADDEKLRKLLQEEESIKQAEEKLIEAECEVAKNMSQRDALREKIATFNAEIAALRSEEDQLKQQIMEKSRKLTEIEAKIPMVLLNRLSEIIEAENRQSEALLSAYVSNPNADFKGFCDSYIASRKQYHHQDIMRTRLQQSKYQAQPRK